MISTSVPAIEPSCFDLGDFDIGRLRSHLQTAASATARSIKQCLWPADQDQPTERRPRYRHAAQHASLDRHRSYGMQLKPVQNPVCACSVPQHKSDSRLASAGVDIHEAGTLDMSAKGASVVGKLWSSLFGRVCC